MAAPEMGQGLFIKVAQVVAEELQVDLDRIKITATSTGKVPNTSATAASSGSDINGMAARAAARILKQWLIDFAAARYGVAPGEITFLPGRVRIGAEEKPFAALINEAYLARVPPRRRAITRRRRSITTAARPRAILSTTSPWRGGERGAGRYADRRIQGEPRRYPA
jgi:xanthine dehydrogenase molybdopterin-binding subunit B